MESFVHSALRQALDCAHSFIGATSPNPPVGAAALDSEGRILAVGAHERAGTAHAETIVIQKCREYGLLEKMHTLVVTLEPCNHTGRTPPCTDVILSTPVRRVVFGTPDPNLRVPGKGAERLKAAGLEVLSLNNEECRNLINPFRHWTETGRPWVTVKTALDPSGSMIPPKGQKTFTSEKSLTFAHALRRRADAIVTGSGTVLADFPEFTVRHLPDHPAKKRWLVVLDRRKRVPDEWLSLAQARGFSLLTDLEFEPALDYLGANGALEVLVEAGPTLSRFVLNSGLWNRHVVIRKGTPLSLNEDTIEITNRSYPS